MRKADLSPDRARGLTRVSGRPNVFALNPAPADLLGLPHVSCMEAAAEALSNLAAELRHLPRPDLVNRSLSRREAVASSRIEGTQAGLSDLFAFESTHDAHGLPPDTRSTLAYAQALEFGLEAVRERGRTAFSVELLQSLHARLMEHMADYRDPPGQFRSVQNWIGGLRIEDARLVPAEPGFIAGAIDALVELLRHEDSGNAHVHVLRRAAVAHVQFESIHPFRDGNGRTGRLLIPLMLAAEGYPPLYVSGPMYRKPSAYFDALLEAQLRSRWDLWLHFFADAVVIACDEALDTTRRLLALRSRWQDSLTGLRVDSASHRVAELLIGTPVLTASRAATLAGVSLQAANTALKALLERGLVAAPLTRRNRCFVATEVIDILDAPPRDPLGARLPWA